jgi:ankyrin repeat protein
VRKEVGVPTISLPDDPSLEHLRGQARSLQRAADVGDPVARQRIHRVKADHDGAVPLSLAQLAVAREYGFASWPRLRHHLAVIAWFRRDPSPDGPSAAATDDAFCRLACLNYTSDGPDRWAAARRLLDAEPDLPRRSIWAAAVASDPSALTAWLTADPTLARAEGGPYRLTALAYLAYSRLDPFVELDPVLDAARILLRAGADPNAGYLWRGLPCPFTVLTGVLGEGEQGARNQPRHPHWYALARLLLKAGADPNDGQGLYNRMFVPGTEHLELLLEHGLGTGDGGPWRARLGDALDPPDRMLRQQLRRALGSHHADRVRLLAEHGVDIVAPFDDGRTPVELAALAGDPDVVAYLVSRGVPAPRLSPLAALVAAIMAEDDPDVARLVAADPDLPGHLRSAHPELVLEAAQAGRVRAVTMLADLGFDVSARARPRSGYVVGATALHRAALDGHEATVVELLRLGADPTLRDGEHDSTPLRWAEHAGQARIVDLLAPVTPGVTPATLPAS